jgi:WD40 repeat protein
MAKIFVSYSRKDIEFAKRLTAELQKSDLDFWIDWEGIPPTVDWWKEIEKGIEEADVFIFLISPDSAKSKVCGQEIDHAVQNGKRLIPLVVRDITVEETLPQLSHLNWIFFREGDDFNNALQKLLSGIHTDYEWVKAHRRLQMKALEWERSNKEHSFLLRGKDLQDAELQHATNTSKEPHPTDLQREYVFASRKAVDRQKRVTTGISIAGIIALAALAIFGFVQAGLAKAEARRATAGKLALESKTSLESFPQRALLLALEAVRTNQAANEPVLPEAEEALRFAVERVPGVHVDGLNAMVTTTQFVEDAHTGTWLIAGSNYPATEVRIWNFNKLMSETSYKPFEINIPADQSEENPIYPLVETSPQNTWLVTNATDGYSLWQIADADETRTPVYFQTQPVFINPNDDTLILEKQEKDVVLWRVFPDSLEKQEVGRLAGEYSGTSPQKNWVVIKSADGNMLWSIVGKDTDRQIVRFKGEIKFSSSENDRWIFEKLSGRALLWDLDSVTFQKKEARRFDGNFVDVKIDPQGRWLIASEDISHPEIMVSSMGENGELQEAKPWVSTTLHIFSLDNLNEPVLKYEMEEHGSLLRFSPYADMMLFTATTLPDESGWSPTKLGLIKLESGTPAVYMSKDASYDDMSRVQFINGHWAVNPIYNSPLYDLRDNDMEPDIFVEPPPILVDDSGTVDLTKLISGKYLVAGDERIALDLLDETRTLVREPNPDADPAQTDIAKLLKFHPLTLGVEDDVTASAISPDGNWLIAGTADGSLRLWDYKRPWISSIQMETSPHSMTLSNDNKWLAIGNTLWKLDHGRPSASYPMKLKGGVFSYSTGMTFSNEAGVFSPDSHWFIDFQTSGQPTANENTPEVNVTLLNLTEPITTTTVEPELISQPGEVYSTVQFSPNSEWVVVGGSTGAYSGQANAFLMKLKDKSIYPLPSFDDAVFTTDQEHLILIPPAIYNMSDNTSTYQNPEVWILPKTSGDVPEKIGSFDAQGQPVVISRNGRWLVIANVSEFWVHESVESRVWDVNCVIQNYECEPFHVSTSTAAFSPDSRYLVLGWASEEDNLITSYEIWDMQPWEKNRNARPVKITSGTSSSFSPAIGKTGSLVILGVNESCDYGGRPTSTAALSSAWEKHPWLANLSTFDGYAYLNLEMGGGGGGAEPGYHVDYRESTLVRDGRNYQSIILRGHESSITAYQVSPNERYVLTFSGGSGTGCSEQRENILRLWDMEKMKEDPLTQAVILPLKYDSETSIKHLAFSPDSNWVYVIDNDNVLYYFPTSIEILKERACQAAGRNFIANEWERFFPGEPYRKTCESLPVHPSTIPSTEVPPTP